MHIKYFKFLGPICLTFGMVGVAAAQSGESVYNNHCAMCHASGVGGAPTLGDKAAWAPFVGAGIDAMVQHVISGIKTMPPKGGCQSCSDAEIKAAVEYIVQKSS